MKRYSTAPLIDAIERRFPHDADERRSVAMGYAKNWVRDLRSKVWIGEHAADKAAVQTGYHPWELWPTWFDDAPAEGNPGNGCGTYAGSQTHRRRKEPLCGDCKAAYAAYSREFRRKQRAGGPKVPKDKRRFAFEPLEKVAGSISDIARRAETDRTTIQRWKRHGLTSLAADRIAVAYGYHPSELWPEWLDEAAS